MTTNYIFEGVKLNKSFGPTIALKDVDFVLKRGEVRGLVGENGSGKSTIMSIASGMQQLSSGEMYYKGEKWSPQTMIEAQRAGISMILQEANTIPDVTVAQNIFAGREQEFSRFGIVNMKKMIHEANKLFEIFDITHINAKNPINYYNFEDRKLIEIIRSVDANTEILVIDETTTALSIEGRRTLYRLIRKLADVKKAVVFISHDMDEILEHCDVLTVLRDGDIIGHIEKDEMKQPNIAQKIRYMMVGREIGEKYYREDFNTSHSNEVALELNNITSSGFKQFNLTLHKGEIIGIGGLSGSGMHELGRIAFGLVPLEAGVVLRNGQEIKNCLQAINAGIGYISKNRDSEALILDGSIQDNICLPSLSKMGRGGFIRPNEERILANKEIDYFKVKCRNGNQWVNTLSGGNKQKVSFAKWTAKGSEVIIMDCPTRGVDIGVKQAMYSLIEKMKQEGKAILMITEELPELIGMADRILIMKDNEVKKEYMRSPELKETDLIEYMI